MHILFKYIQLIDLSIFLFYNRFSNGDAAIELIKKVHKMTDDRVNYLTSININLNSDVSVVNIYCTSDPIVDYQLNFDYINSNK